MKQAPFVFAASLGVMFVGMLPSAPGEEARDPDEPPAIFEEELKHLLTPLEEARKFTIPTRLHPEGEHLLETLINEEVRWFS